MLSIMDGPLLLWRVLCFYCLFSYSSLLELPYEGRIWKSQAAREQAREMRISAREAEWRIDTELFLDKYPRWELGASHQSVILYEMFLHAAKWGCKEAERLICRGCCGSTSEPNLEADYSAMDLVGYWTSHKEICDIYHSGLFIEEAPQVFPLVRTNREWEQVMQYPLLPNRPVALSVGTLPQPEKAKGLRRNGCLDLIGENHMRKSSGWPTKGCWKLLKCSEVILKG